MDLPPSYGSPLPSNYPHVPNEHSPLTPPGETVLVLSPHARTGRRLSILASLVFMVGFHAALVCIATMNWSLPCERPLAAYLLSAGVVGTFGALLHFALEVKRLREESSLLPTETREPASLVDRVLSLITIAAAAFIALVGGALYSSAPTCSYTSPIVYNWAAATLLLYCAFAFLVGLVPVLTATLPLLAAALLPLIAVLVALANWVSDAGKRGAASAITILHHWASGGDGASSMMADAEAGGGPSVLRPPGGGGGAGGVSSTGSTFALYINTSVLLWLFGFLLLEARRSWSLPCDVPLASFVLGAGVLGMLLTVASFVGEVYADPLPPVTKLEQSRAREERRRKLLAYGWMMGAAALWGALGCLWLRQSETCGHSSPSLYRVALMLGFVYMCFVSLAALLALFLAIDYCLSGKLRFVVILEQ